MNKSVFALLCITGITCGAMAAADPDGLVAAYDFTDAQDGLVRDYGPNANPAILHSFTGKTSDALCREPGGKQVFRGDGNGNFVTIPDHPELRRSKSFTVELVCTIEKFPADSVNALFAFESTRARLWIDPSGTISLDSTPAEKPDYFSSPKVKVSPGEKLHIFAFISNDEIGLAVNGKIYTSDSYRGVPRQTPGDISIGGHPFRSNRYFKGTIEKILFYNRRLSDQEMKTASTGHLRPSALSKSGIFAPGEQVSFRFMDGRKAAADAQVVQDTWSWQTDSGTIRRKIVRKSAESRQRLLAGLVSRRNFPALYTDKLQLCLDNRLFGQFDALFQQLSLHEKQLFRYADRLHRMAQREFDEDLLQGKGKKLPPILTELPPFGKSEFREFVYRKARELYVRNFWLSLGGKHPRVEDRDQFKMLQEQKVKISTIGPLITNAVIQQWLRQHPECQEAGYSFSDQVASGGELQLSVRDPHANLYYNPYQYWQVRDETTKTDVPAESGWTLDREKYTVTVKNTIPGHRYAVYYFARHGTGLNLSLQSEEQVARYLADWEKFCRENQGKILFHHMDGCFHYFTGKRMKWWEFWGYNGCNANPAAQKAFEEFSGMKFRPAMLFASLDGPAINYTPTPEIRAWMRFNQHLVTGFMKRVADIARQNGMMYQFYWGDKHLGFEPDLDAFEKTGIQSIARPLQDAVDVRSMTEQNGKALTSGRLEWLFAHMVNRPDSIAKILDNWQRNRRGELFRIRDMHYFAEFGPVFAYGDAATQDLYMRMFQRINEEFLLMYKYMHDQKIFTHDFNVYVINEWGRQYSWRPWRDPFLRHFTDIPVNMKWISLREIAENGVPEDAAVLLNYGDRGSAWVGTESWRDPRLAANIRNFVKNGGGFLGCGSAADYQGKNQLADVLGFEYVPGPGGNTLNPTAAGEAFLARSIPGSFSGEPFRCDRNILPAPTFTLLASADGKNPVRPLFGENRYGRGRSVYLSFQSNDPEYDDLIKRAIFRAAGREKELYRLYSGNPAIQPYAYPSRNLVVLNNDTRKKQETLLQLDTAIYPALGGKIRIINLIDRRPTGNYTREELARGIPFVIDGGTAEYFLLENQ